MEDKLFCLATHCLLKLPATCPYCKKEVKDYPLELDCGFDCLKNKPTSKKSIDKG